MTGSRHNVGECLCQLSIGNRTVTYTLRKSPRARWLRIQMNAGSGLTVIQPSGCGDRRLQRFLKEKQSWILRMVERYESMGIQPERSIEPGDTVSYLGQPIKVLVRDGAYGEDFRLERGCLMAGRAEPGKRLSVRLEQWYRERAAELFTRKVKEWSHRIGVRPGDISIRGQKTRWGSCSLKGRLSFNWKLLMAPEPVVDYVVSHELSHLMEMNHSPRFWSVVSQYCQHWREHRRWLRVHEAEIARGLG